MSETFTYVPEPKVNGASVLPPSELTIYQSKAAPGAITLTLSNEQFIQAGIRLTKEQALLLAEDLLRLIGEDPVSRAYDEGWKEGEREADDYYQSELSLARKEGFEDGYAEALRLEAA